MSKTLLAAALFAIIGLGACKKDEEVSQIPSNYKDLGSVKFQNNSSDRYDIYLDNYRYGFLDGGLTSTYPDITAGYHRVKAIQTSNINGTATLRDQQVLVKKDSVATFVFP